MNSYNKFITNEVEGVTRQVVPDSPFKLVAKIKATGKDVKVDYFIKEQLRTSTLKHSRNNGVYKFFVKFGIYRTNTIYSIKQTYTNMRPKKAK